VKVRLRGGPVDGVLTEAAGCDLGNTIRIPEICKGGPKFHEYRIAMKLVGSDIAEAVYRGVADG